MAQWQQSQQYGGSGGNPFSDPMSNVKRVVGFRIRSGTYVDSIEALYWTHSGVFWGPKHGGDGGDLHEVFLAPDEEITELLVSSGTYVDSIQIITNKRSYGPFGGNGGDRHAIPLSALGGLFGRSGSLVDAIGLFPARPERHSGGGLDRDGSGDQVEEPFQAVELGRAGRAPPGNAAGEPAPHCLMDCRTTKTNRTT